MLSRVGVMQGRLLPKYHGRYQAHPAGYWQEEFSIAKKLGLSCIEFILDYNDAKDNPLLSNEGIDNINAIIDKTGVAVKTICADYFMEAPIHSENQNVALQSSNILTRLLNNSVSLGVTDVVIPCVDQSSLSSQIYVDNFVQRLSPIVDIAENTKINISLDYVKNIFSNKPQIYQKKINDSNLIGVVNGLYASSGSWMNKVGKEEEVRAEACGTE